jgi:hypothetical protein
MEIREKSRHASGLAGSAQSGDITRGLAMMTDIFSDRRAARDAEFGFVDNALFLARKLAAHADASVREEVVKMLSSVGRASPQWSEAAAETAGEIALQPSDAAREVAERFFKSAGGKPA